MAGVRQPTSPPGNPCCMEPGRLVPQTRSSHHNCPASDCELRVQNGTRINRFASVLRFRSSLPSEPPVPANFGIGTLAPLLPPSCRNVAKLEGCDAMANRLRIGFGSISAPARGILVVFADEDLHLGSASQALLKP